MVTIEKTEFGQLNDKRYILPDGISSFSYEHKDLGSLEAEYFLLLKNLLNVIRIIFLNLNKEFYNVTKGLGLQILCSFNNLYFTKEVRWRDRSFRSIQTQGTFSC